MPGNKNDRLKYTYYLLIFMYLLSSCSSRRNINKEFTYFQHGLDSIGGINYKERVVQINDLLAIQFFSKSINQEQVTLFNIPNGNGTSERMAGYLVNTDGDIDIPIIGKLNVTGLTKEQLQFLLIDKISPYIKEPSVIIRFMQFKVNVLGEVKTPGPHSFETDRVTIMDAISAAGDLSDNGKRNNVLVIREESKKRKYYRINLTSGGIFQSPVYQLQPNDIVYVSASDLKLEEVNHNPNKDSYRGWQFAMSIISVATSVLFVAYNLKK